jgi:hypothetical protein
MNDLILTTKPATFFYRWLASVVAFNISLSIRGALTQRSCGRKHVAWSIVNQR